MGFKEVFKAHLVLLQFTSIAFIASILLVLLPLLVFNQSIIAYVYRRYYPMPGGEAEKLEDIPLPVERMEVFIEPISYVMSWLFTFLLTALLVNVISEGSLRRQLDYAIAYTGAPAKALLIISLSTLTLLFPALIALSLGYCLISYAILGWDYMWVLAVGLHSLISSLATMFTLITLVSYIRAPHRYWLVIVAMMALMYLMVIIEPNSVRFMVPLAGFMDYMSTGRLFGLITPVLLYSIPAIIVFTLLHYRR